MPNPAKAILDPFAPLSVPEALLVALSGIVVVFLMLAMLMAVIYVISWVVGQIEGKLEFVFCYYCARANFWMASSFVAVKKMSLPWLDS